VNSSYDRDCYLLPGEVPCGEVESTHVKDDLSKAYEEALAILRFRPDRLGHALLLPGSLQSILDESHIPIETCPTSNIMTLELATSFHGNLVEGFQRHPRLAYWLRTGYPISVSTDDSGVFHTNPTKELLLLAISHDIDGHSLREIVMQSIQHAFCDDRTKSTLAQRVAHRLHFKLNPEEDR
jgi:adenosine deaminase